MSALTTSFVIEIGGIRVRVQCRKIQEKLLLEMLSGLRGFLVEAADHHFLVDIPDFAYLRNDKEITISKDQERDILECGDFLAAYDPRNREAKVFLHPDPTVFNTFLRVFYSWVGLDLDGVLVHAAGLARKDQGYLFVGPSESGKTTLSNLAQGFQVLGDELVLVRRQEGRFSLSSTPFHGEAALTAPSVSVPLRRVYFLNKHLSQPVRALEGCEQVIRLLQCVFFFSSQVAAGAKVLALCRGICERFAGPEVNMLAKIKERRLIDVFRDDDMDPEFSDSLAEG